MPTIIHDPGSPIAALLRMCRRIAASDATVLITGETGTGKELVARAIHEVSERRGHEIVTINCAAIPEALLESELFGYKRGAFTDARRDKPGRILAAHGGTLFLDEIGELPAGIQAKLLRLLQDRTYEPIGSCKPIKVDFRLVAATNRDLDHEVEVGRFRRDLYHRLLVCPIEVPPLRRRRMDIAPLITHFWARRSETRMITGEALRSLGAYGWPGNVRELENMIERLSVCVESEEIALADLPPTFNVAPCSTVPIALDAPIALDQPVDLPAMLRQVEAGYINAALARTGGNRKAAADLLGLKRTALVEKLRRRAICAKVADSLS